LNAEKKIPVEFRQFKVWRDLRIFDADISEMRAIADNTPVPETGLCQRIETALLEHGVSPMPDIVFAVEKAVESHAWQCAAEGLRRMLLSLPDTPSVLALRALVFGADDQSLREAAARAGCSQAAVSKALKKLAKSFRKLSPACVR
jgi:hypothetical protein